MSRMSAREQLLQVVALSGFAVAQPVYDLLGQNPTFFIYRRWQPGDFLFFVLLLSFLLPIGVAALAEVPGLLRPRARRWARAVPLVLLSALISLPLLVRFESADGWLIVGVATALGVGVALLRERFGLFRQFLTILVPTALIFPSIFLFRDGIREQWLSAQTSWESSGAGSRAPVVLLVFDALPTASLMDDRHGVDPVRYPNFARLAETSTWFRRATTVDPFTASAVPAILSGECRKERKAPLLQEYPRNIFTHAANRYRFEAVETATHLCPSEICGDRARPFGKRFFPLLLDATIAYAHAVSPVDWRTGLPPVDNAWGDFAQAGKAASRVRRSQRSEEIAEFEDALTRISRSSPPVFLFAHLVFPHQPFVFLPSGMSYRQRVFEPGFAEPWSLRHSYQRHLLQLAYVDSLLGEALDRLDATGLFDESLIVVTADHGVSFREGESARELSGGNAVDILSVPLFIKRPGQRAGEILDQPAQTADILPTVAEILELSEPEWADGRSLLGDNNRETLSCPQVRDEPAPAMPPAELWAAVEAKVALFGTGAARSKFPAVGVRPELVGVPAAEVLCGGAADLQWALDHPELYEQVDRSSGFVPAEITGLIQGPLTDQGVDLAVAINGTIAATTRSYVSGARDVFPWSAIVPESTLLEGPNRVSLYALAHEGSGCALRPVRSLDGEAVSSFMNVRLGAWPVPLVEETGFAKSRRVNGATLREIRRKAELRVPLPPGEAGSVRRLKLDLEVLDQGGITLKVHVNGKRLLQERPQAGPWLRTLELEPPSGEGPLMITLRGVRSDPSERKNVLAVRGIWLLPGEG